MVQQFTSRSAGNTKLVHVLGVGAARRSSAENEEQSSSAEYPITNRVQYTSLNDQLKNQLGGQLGHESCSNENIDWLEVTPEDEEESACWGTRSVSIKPNWRTQEDQLGEQLKCRICSDIGSRETRSSEDDENQLKSGCKREEKKRALNGLKKQPARTRPAQCRPE
ncbi:DEAD/DEAH box helicase [Dorcoceras hygrometricum]|uniref:DEAD/DEAH box helicase n=1 Tax=Dorcoceras hygrometricum TaxID=472368 RepID=A0A2Z7D5E6_9LAMI|nr:DEAD/DEAH box helicase [Dorcoceras hygrometricum]